MKKIIEYFVDNSIVVNLLTLLIIVMGVMSLFSLNKETFPMVDFNYISVRVAYQGAAAEDVEKLISVEVERELKSVDGIDEINSLSGEGAAIISLKIDPDADTDDVLIDVRNALANLSQKVPSEVEAPVISKRTNTKRSLIKIALVEPDEKVLRANAKYIRDSLERFSSISEVTMDGYRDEVFDIQVKQIALEKYEVTLTQILNAIKDRQTNITAGNLKGIDREKLIRTLVENETVAQLENVVILSNDIGDAVRVKDVAIVRRVLKDPSRVDAFDGKPAIILGVKAKVSADVLKTAALIKKEIKSISLERGFKYKTYDDKSFYVKRRLGVLSQNGIQGIIFVVICLALFMNFRVSLITSLGAPFAFLVSFALMDSFGITINLISMFALILVLGMLVDDSIIVAEQYFQYLEKGMKPKPAAKQAALDTLGPVTSTVITTMVAFGSLFYMQGIMGKFLWAVPAVVIICLVASWIECFVILPGHLADWGGDIKNIEKKKWYQPLQDQYQKCIEFCIHHAKTTLGIFIALFIVSVATAVKMRFELFPADDVTFAYLNIKGPVGTSLEKTTNKLKELEAIVVREIKKDEIVGYRSISGYQFARHGGTRIGSHYGTVFIELTMQDFRDRKTDQILKEVSKEIKKRIGDFSFSLEVMKGGPPTGKGVNVELSSESLADLKLASKEVNKKFESMKEILSSEVDFELGKEQIIVDINEAEARRLGVSNLAIAMELRNAFEGLVATTIKSSDEDIDVLVRLAESERGDINTLKKIKVSNSSGQRIPLLRMAKLVDKEGAFVIRRYQRRRTFAVSAEVDRLSSTSREVNARIKPFLKEIVTKYPGMIFQLTGENKDTNDSMKSFKKALIGSAFIIFIILVVQFSSMAQPLIIMSAIPFGLIGVVSAFLVFGLPLGFMALMGMLGLVGVVINDSIVLVSFINRYINEMGLKKETIIKACVSRFRPVILTTITTVVGLLPVAHWPGGDPFLKPMATSFAYGLLFSSAITLIFVPTCYYLYLKGMQHFGKVPNFKT
jgi:multidrug efflux pump subunit AcrB